MIKNILLSVLSLLLFASLLVSAPRVAECFAVNVPDNSFRRVSNENSIVDLVAGGQIRMDELICQPSGECERLLSIGCVVIEPVTGIAKFDINLDGNNFIVYEDSDKFFYEVQPWSKGNGSQVGDSFHLDLPETAQQNQLIVADVTGGAQSGKLFCVVWSAIQ